MFHLACTRFNNNTYQENREYRHKTGETVIYGSPLKIRNIYPTGYLMFVAEMNNETNKIEGIGLIKNTLVCDRRHKIYENTEYNRYTYRGSYWLSREQINNLDPEVLDIFDDVLFKGKSHLKCRIGITVITEKLFVHWIHEYRTLKHKVKDIFVRQFTRQDISSHLALQEEEEQKEEEQKEEEEQKV